MFIFPISFAQVETLEKDTISFCKIYITGHGSVTLVGPLLFFNNGFGYCPLMIANLESNGYVEIFKTSNPDEKIILDGNQTLTIIGFFGMFDNGGCGGDSCKPFEIDGMTIFCTWNG
jgi:uncharacterized membrane protein